MFFFFFLLNNNLLIRKFVQSNLNINSIIFAFLMLSRNFKPLVEGNNRCLQKWQGPKECRITLIAIVICFSFFVRLHPFASQVITFLEGNDYYHVYRATRDSTKIISILRIVQCNFR